MTAIVRPEAVTAPGFRSVLTGHTWPASLSNCAEGLLAPLPSTTNRRSGQHTVLRLGVWRPGGDRVIVRGALRSLLVLLTVATLVFVLIHASGDPLAGFTPAGRFAGAAGNRSQGLGLDRPLIAQYGILRDLASGDFGESWRAKRSALDLVIERVPASLRLSALALGIAIVVGGGLGMLAGRRPGGAIDAFARLIALAGQAMPAFWVGTVLILFVAVRMRWLPSSGGDEWRSLILPARTLSLYPMGIIARMLRGA